METKSNRKNFDYDIFLSHNRVDKEWVRIFASRISDSIYNGRHLRPWLDERFLDPGSLSDNKELTIAIDRSRFFGYIMSPEAISSHWVDFEHRYFLNCRNTDEIINILLRNCEVPDFVEQESLFDFRCRETFEMEFSRIINKICPKGEITVDDVKESIDIAIEQIVLNDPGGFDPSHYPYRDSLFDALSHYDIDDLISEGFAITAFNQAADGLLQLVEKNHDVLYNYKMLLGECLAAAIKISSKFRQVTHQYIDISKQHEKEGIELLFVVVRAYSKLAEIDYKLMDMTVLLHICTQLDMRKEIGGTEEAILVLLGRTIGKFRNSPLGEFLIKTLSERGGLSKIVAAYSIAVNIERDSSVFYLTRLENMFNESQNSSLQLGPPSRKLVGELYGIRYFDEAEYVQQKIEYARSELKNNFKEINDIYYPLLWGTLKKTELLTTYNIPFIGTIVKATLKNMVIVSNNLKATDVVCLTEPRIVDSLFYGCSALLIQIQDEDSPQCRRLQDRGIPYCMMIGDFMSELNDGDIIMIDHNSIHLYSVDRQIKLRKYDYWI